MLPSFLSSCQDKDSLFKSSRSPSRFLRSCNLTDMDTIIVFEGFGIVLSPRSLELWLIPRNLENLCWATSQSMCWGASATCHFRAQVGWRQWNDSLVSMCRYCCWLYFPRYWNNYKLQGIFPHHTTYHEIINYLYNFKEHILYFSSQS